MDSFQYIESLTSGQMGEKFPILKISCLQLRAAMIYVWMHQWNRFSVKKDIFFPVLYFQPLYNFDFFSI